MPTPIAWRKVDNEDGPVARNERASGAKEWLMPLLRQEDRRGYMISMANCL
jgi:hypothetical protein